MDIIDICKDCDVPDLIAVFGPFDSESFFACADCPCFRCPHKHSCSGQCGVPFSPRG